LSETAHVQHGERGPNIRRGPFSGSQPGYLLTAPGVWIAPRKQG